MTNRSGDTAHRQSRGTAPRWTREQIRAARMAPLLPLLERRGLALVETGAGNFGTSAYPGLVVKDSYWRWPERGIGGNAIDFCTVSVTPSTTRLELTEAS